MANPADITQLRAICQSLQGRAKRLQQFARVQKQAQQKVEREINKAGYMEDIIRLRFLQERTSVDTGSQWAPRKDPGDGHPVLRDTGKLLAAAVRAVRNTFRLGVQIKWNIGRVTVPYAIYHQQGTPNMVARKFFSDPTKRELAAAYAYANKMVKQLVATGLGIKGTRR